MTLGSSLFSLTPIISRGLQRDHMATSQLLIPLFILLVCVVAQSCLTLCNPMDCGPPGSSVHGIFSRQEYWSGLPFPSPGDLPDPGIEPSLLNYRQFIYHLSHQGWLFIIEVFIVTRYGTRLS